MTRSRCCLAVLLALPVAGCVVDDPIGARAKEEVGTGVRRNEGAHYDERTDSYSFEVPLDLGEKTETEALVDTMRGRER